MSEGQQAGGGGIQDQGAPLTPEEKRMVERLFSEPLEFPQIFRNWLKNFIETAGIILPKSSIAAGAGSGTGSFAGWPAGCIVPLGGSVVPVGALPCNGIAVSRTQYASLFAAIGTVWGAGDGSTTFNLPDLRDRALYGAGSKVGLGQTDGGALGVRGPKHNHYVSIANSSSGYNTLNGSAWGTSDGGGGHGHSLGAVSNKAINNADSPLATPATSGGGSFYTDGVGDHSHYGNYSAQVGGTVNVSGTVNGSTSGGGQQDTPAYAGVQYVITT